MLHHVFYSATRLVHRLVFPGMDYPLPNFHFSVEWGGQRLGFSEVSGLDIEYAAIAYREGADPQYRSTRMPGQQKPGTVTLKRGLVEGDNEFFDWINTIALNKVERRDVLVKLLNERHEPVFVWRIRNAWPVKYIGPELNAHGNEVAIEALELAHDGITVEAV